MQADTLDIQPLKPGFGAEVLDCDITKADAATKRAVVDIFQRHGALLLRDQVMSPADLLDFVKLVGEPERHTLLENTIPGYPNIYVLSNRVTATRGATHKDGVGWHTDYSYKEEPVMCTMLYAVEVPAEGGDTLLADGVAAFAALPEARQRELERLKLHHSFAHFIATRDHSRMLLTEEQLRENPDVVHPLIHTHPADGRKALWVSTGTVTEVIGAAEPTDLSILDELVEFATQERFVFRHKWRVGDVLMWDNRCTLHTGSTFDDTRYFRTMHRLWVKGDRPS